MSKRDKEIAITILPISSPDELGAVAERIMAKALANPDARELIEQLLKDPQATPKALFDTAFTMGIAAALGEIIQGHIVGIGTGPAYSDS